MVNFFSAFMKIKPIKTIFGRHTVAQPCRIYARNWQFAHYWIPALKRNPPFKIPQGNRKAAAATLIDDLVRPRCRLGAWKSALFQDRIRPFLIRSVGRLSCEFAEPERNPNPRLQSGLNPRDMCPKGFFRGCENPSKHATLTTLSFCTCSSPF